MPGSATSDTKQDTAHNAGMASCVCVWKRLKFVVQLSYLRGIIHPRSYNRGLGTPGVPRSTFRLQRFRHLGLAAEPPLDSRHKVRERVEYNQAADPWSSDEAIRI